MNTINNVIASFQRMIRRYKYSEVDNLKTVKTTMRTGAVRAEYIQDWGFISIPPETTTGEAVVIYPNASESNGIIIKATDPEAIPEGFLAGDTGLFNNAGVVIKLSGKNVTITGAESIDLGTTVQKLVNESFLKVFDSHTHTYVDQSGSKILTAIPTVPSTDINKTTVLGAE